MRIQVLGPVRGWFDDAEVDLGPLAQRAVLGLLVLAGGQPVTVAELADGLWPHGSPSTAANVLQTHISRLRRLLELGRAPRSRSVVLPLTGGGYALRLPAEEVDLALFRQLVQRSDRCRAAGELAAADLLGQALRLWRGAPLAGIAVLANHPKVVALGRERDAALSHYAQTAIAAGTAVDALPVLSEAAAAQPLDEAAQARLIRAYHAAGQRAAAFDHHRETRRRLVDELGVDPGPELRAAHALLLDAPTPRPAPRTRGTDPAGTDPARTDPARTDPARTDPARTDPAGTDPAGTDPAGTAGTDPAGSGEDFPAGPPAGARPLVAPAQLPGDVPGFVGRAEQLARLDALLAGGEAGAAGTVPLAAVCGTAGVGKTALVVHWAHRVRDRFPDGQLYLNLRGFDPAGQVLDPAAATRQFLEALGVPADRIPTEPEARSALYRSLLAGRRVLVVLDNARDTAQVRPLLPGAPGCLVLVSSRTVLTGLVAAHGAEPVAVDLLSPPEARQLLVGRLGSARTGAEPAAVAEIVTGCARLPLALAIAAARAATQPHLRLATLAGELRDTRATAPAGADDDPHTDLHTVFSWSYGALTPEAGRLFRLLGLHPGPDITVPAAAALAAVPAGQVRRSLTELTLANLLSEAAGSRYTFHDLLRGYATDLAHRVDGDPERLAATERILDHYLHSADAADRALQGTSRHLRITLALPRPGVVPEQPADPPAALRWFTAERPVMLAVLARAAAAGFDRHAWQLAWTLRIFLNRQGHWDDMAAAGSAALAAGQRLGDPAAQVRAHRDLARSCSARARPDEAHAHLTAALDLAVRAGDEVGQSDCHANLVPLLIRLGRPDEALEHATRFLELARQAGQPAGIGSALNHLGWAYTHLGDHAQALACCEQALPLLEAAGTPNHQASTLDTLGLTHRHLGHTAEAVDCYRRAVVIFGELGDLGEQASTLTTLGDTLREGGDPAGAREAWRQAEDIFAGLGHPDADRLRAKLAELARPGLRRAERLASG